MKKVVIPLIILIGISFLVWFAYINHFSTHHCLQQKKVNTTELYIIEPVLALYSFDTIVQDQLISSFPHFKVILKDKGKLKIKNNLIVDIDDSIPVMITVEIRNSNGIDRTFSNPLEKLVNGNYNEAIECLCKELISERPNVFVRINPEMEVPVNRYPWQYRSGPEYIKAFRYFAKKCKIYSPQAKIVWGPAGYPGAMEYYPGDDVVDVATITCKSDSEQPLNVYPKDYTTQYDLFRRLHRLRFINKPIFILGSNQIENNSIDSLMLSEITNIINKEKEVIYSTYNFIRPPQQKLSSEERNIIIGVYDYYSYLVNEEPITVEHLFVAFDNLRDGRFKKDFQKVIERGHDVIVSFEPFHLPDGGIDSNCLQSVIDGKYNNDLNDFFSIIMSTNQRIYLRYAHEMEIPITRYAWQSQDPVDYIHSYRHFMTYIKPWPENIKRVWGPAGDRGSIEWYPGDDLVDYISVTIFGLSDKNITDPDKQESFSTIYNRKSWRFRFNDKPLFITEFGVKGSEEFQTKWLEDAALVIRENPKIVGINYFNMTDNPQAWGEVKPPDWSITEASFHRFIEILRSNNQ